MSNSEDPGESGLNMKSSSSCSRGGDASGAPGPAELRVDWDKLGRIRKRMLQEFAPCAENPVPEPNDAELVHDELARKVLRALSRNPCLTRRAVVPRQTDDAQLSHDSPLEHGYTCDNETVKCGNSFAVKLPGVSSRAEGRSRTTNIERIVPPWRQATGKSNHHLYHVHGDGGWSARWASIGPFTEFVSIVLSGELQIRCGQLERTLTAIPGESVACMSVWRSARARTPLPLVRLLAGRRSPTSVILVGRAHGDVPIKDLERQDEPCSSSRASEGRMGSTKSGSIPEHEQFDAPIGANGIKWARGLPELIMKGYTHLCDQNAGHFTPYLPIPGDVNRPLSMRVFVVHGMAPSEMPAFSYHDGGAEFILPLHGNILMSYAPRSITGEGNQHTRKDLPSEAITAQIVGSAEQSNGRLRPTLIAMDPLEPHGMTTADFRDAVCLQINVALMPQTPAKEAGAHRMTDTSVSAARGKHRS